MPYASNHARAGPGTGQVREDSYFEAGMRLLEGGDYAGSVAMFDSAIKLGLGDLAAVNLCRARALSLQDDLDGAASSVEAALALEPYLADAYNERGRIRRARRELEAAVDDFTMAIHIEPDYVEAYVNRAAVWEERRHHAEAEADLTRALKLDPDLLGAYEARGRARAAQFKFEAAVGDISHYLRAGGGRAHDNHSETQGYLLILRVARALWRVLGRGR